MADFNPDVSEILKEHKIDREEGLLILLGYYYGLDIEAIAPEASIKAISLTKIVEKDYRTSNTLKWNIPLFEGEDTSFSWVKEWVEKFRIMNTDRAGSYRDAISRMKLFFSKYPEYRKEDVFAATELYFKRLLVTGGATYCMKSHKFIFDGVGAEKKSTLLEYCEKVKRTDSSDATSNYQRGDIIS